MTFTHALATNNYGPAKWIVDASAANGTHTTIASALTSASSGDTIFIRPGTYTENLTLKVGVNLTAYGSDSSLNQTGKVIISGTCTLTTAGTVTISGIQLQTNSANLLAVTGSAASIVNLVNCNLNCSNNTGISFTSSSASATISISNCTGDLGTTGIALFSHSSAGSLAILYSMFTNSGGSSTANTISAGSLAFVFGAIKNPITVSGTASIGFELSDFNSGTQNVIAFTAGGSGTQTVSFSAFAGGTASAISISQTLTIVDSNISSTNTNAVTGAGTINYSNLSFSNTSKTINTSTQSGGVAIGSTNTAPSAGFIGEQIRGYAASVSPSNNTPTTITSINLTAGVWDISAVGYFVFTGNNTAIELAISTNNNSFTGTTIGDSIILQNATNTGGTQSATIPSFRAVVTTTTTYYAVGLVVFSTGACTASARISGTRVG